ncbi:MAG: glycosyltransferase N-terminal domain-containing protein [Candidatus Tenebribacter davisii]|jgi:3-deoxy-D-manno-octulosonic-acid transferase|nr:glycosyltransferase N-terminal domain-containing protein [Candidatus Tenebribacter davisii]
MFIYRLLTSILFRLCYPFIKLRKKNKKEKQRLGIIKNGHETCVWLHASSVGEVNAVKPLVNQLLQKYPHKDFFMTTMTSTGLESAKKISPKLVVSLFPIDVSYIQKRFFNTINPEIIILVETELWPNMLHVAKKRNIPVIMVNARISDRSFPRYRNLRLLWKPVWKAVKAVNAQSEKDTRRFIGFKFNNVINAHNLKFCINLPEFKRSKLRKELGYSKDDFILIWGSSRPGEEKLLKEVFAVLKAKINNLKIIIVPRHLHRIPQVCEIFKEYDYKIYTKLGKPGEILLVDEMGILNMMYALSDIAIVGGSFLNYGGHNPLEPAFYSIPIIIGKYNQSCRDSVDRLLDNNGIIVSDKKKLTDDIMNLYNNKELREQLGYSAKQTLGMNSDSLKINLEILGKYIK